MKKAFTLIELLIVITIIGILAAIVAINLDDVQSKSRDARRKSDLNTIGKAVQLYQNQYDTFRICDGVSRSCGYQGHGVGYFNYRTIAPDDDYSTNSINDALISLNLLSGTIIDPTGGTNQGNYYMYTPSVYYAWSGASVYCILENPSAQDTATTNNSANLDWVNTYKLNYAVTLIP